MNTSCKCSDFSRFVKASDADPYFRDLSQVAVKDADWTTLRRCTQCGQYWQVDSWDKLQVNLAIKIETPENWESNSDQHLRVDALMYFRGGVSEEECMWAGCTRKRLKGLVSCLECAYRDGVRE